jgi:hypothetical protein
MRSGTGTKSGEPGLMTFSTKAMMDCFAGPSFHDGSGSAALRSDAGESQRNDGGNHENGFERHSLYAEFGVLFHAHVKRPLAGLRTQKGVQPRATAIRQSGLAI